MMKNSNIKTVKIKLKPGEFKPIFATFKSGRTILYTMDIIEDLKTDPDVLKIEDASGKTLYNK